MKNTDSNLLLIHNKGYLARREKSKTRRVFFSKFFLVKNSSLKYLERNIHKIIKQQNIHLIAYISGETKDKN